MAAVGRSLRHDLLGLLLDAGSSFAALYGSLIRNCNCPPDLNIGLLLDTLEELEEVGLVRAAQMGEGGGWRRPTAEDRTRDRVGYQDWLGSADWQDPDAFAVDEVGLWYEVTPEGGAEWRRWAREHGEELTSTWMLEDVAITQTITIHAATEEQATERLRWWLAQNAHLELAGESRRMEPIPAFQLRNGTVVTNGWKLTCRYRQASKN